MIDERDNLLTLPSVAVSECVERTFNLLTSFREPLLKSVRIENQVDKL